MSFRKALVWGLISAAAIAAVALFAACGDDDNSSKSSSNGSPSSGQLNGGTGSDEQYVSTFCKAAAKFTDDIANATKDPSKLADPTAAANLLVTPLQDYVNALKQAKPPSDAKDFHNAVVKALDDALTSLKTTHDISSFASVGEDLPTPPASVSDRLQKVAEKNSDCQKAGFDFTNSGG